jgi:hypothetical protein
MEEKILEILKIDQSELVDYCMALLSEKDYSLPPNLTSLMASDLSKRLKAFIIAYFLDNLPPEAYREIERMALEPKRYTREDYDKFLSKYLPNYSEVIRQAMEDFRRTFLGIG